MMEFSEFFKLKGGIALYALRIIKIHKMQFVIKPFEAEMQRVQYANDGKLIYLTFSRAYQKMIRKNEIKNQESLFDEAGFVSVLRQLNTMVNT